MAKILPKKLASYWWMLLLEGLLQLILGLLLLVSTDMTVFILIQILGIYWLIRGLIMIVQMFAEREKNRGWLLLGGILGIMSGIIVLRYPVFSSFILLDFLVILIAFVGIVQGTVSIINGAKTDNIWQILLGIVIWIICLALFFNPLSSVAALPIVIGILWVLDGTIMTVMSFFLRR